MSTSAAPLDRGHAGIDPCGADRCRIRFVEVLGTSMAIPRHIKRVDGRRSHGWQVTFDQPSRYFGDAGHDGPQGAFEAACAYLRSIWRPIRKHSSRGYNRQLHTRTTGVRTITVQNASGALMIYAVTDHPRLKHVHRRFYAGTPNSCTPAKLANARRLALLQRQLWLQACTTPLR